MDHHQYITNESERKSGKHLTSEDRGAIQATEKLGCSASRGKAIYQANRKNSRKPHKIDRRQEFVRWVLKQMRQRNWSIDACVGYA